MLDRVDYSSEMGRLSTMKENFLRVVLSIGTKGSGEVYIAAVRNVKPKSPSVFVFPVKQTHTFTQSPISVKGATAQHADTSYHHRNDKIGNDWNTYSHPLKQVTTE